MYNTIIIGAGSIGALKDDKYDSPETENILTHAHMYYNHPETKLFAVIDNNGFKAAQASQKWNCFNYLNLPDFFPENIDIVSVCTSTDTHKNILLNIIKYKPKIVIAEKPFCSNSDEAIEVIKAYKKADIPIIVNYPRRFVPEIMELKKDIRNEKYGKIFSATFHYTRGLQHEMCHGIDLLRNLFGEYKRGELESPRKTSGISDRDANDTTMAAWLGFEKCPHVFLSPCDGREYKVFQLEIMTEKGKIILSQHGMYIDYYPLFEEPIWGGFKILSKNIETRTKTQLNRSLEYLCSHAVAMMYCINTNQFNYDEIISKPEDALEVHKIIEQLKGE